MTRMVTSSIALLALIAAPASALPFKDAVDADGQAGAGTEHVDVIEKLNGQVPLDLEFVDAHGKPFVLGELFRDEKPVVLTLAYYECPVLCNLVLSGLASTIEQTGLRLGEDFRALTVSIDPGEGPKLARERKRGHLQAIGLTEGTPDWKFLTGDAGNIRTLAEAVGFRYTYDEDLKQYAHAAVMMVLTPEGRVSRYLYGVDPNSKNLRLSLVEAADGRTGTSFDRFILSCFKYDPVSRKYAFYISAYLRVGGVLIFAGLASLLAVLWRRDLKRSSAKGRTSTTR